MELTKNEQKIVNGLLNNLDQDVLKSLIQFKQAGELENHINHVFVHFHSIGLSEFAEGERLFPLPMFPAAPKLNDKISPIYKALMYLIQVHDGLIEPDPNCHPDKRINTTKGFFKEPKPSNS